MDGIKGLNIVLGIKDVRIANMTTIYYRQTGLIELRDGDLEYFIRHVDPDLTSDTREQMTSRGYTLRGYVIRMGRNETIYACWRGFRHGANASKSFSDAEGGANHGKWRYRNHWDG